MTTPKTDRELLEMAAKAADYQYAKHGGYIVVDGIPGNWNPLTDDRDALRLAVKLKIRIGFVPSAYADTPAGLRFFGAHDGDDQFSRTRLAIARAAAAIGRAIRTQQCGLPHDPPYQGSAA